MSRPPGNFFDEAYDTLDSMEQMLLAADSHALGREQVDAIFRAAHSVKGSVMVLGLPEVVELLHAAESVLDRLRCGQVDTDGEVTGLLLETVDATRSLLEQHQSGVRGSSETTRVLRERLGNFAPVDRQPLALRSLEIRIGPVKQLQDADAVGALLREFPGMGAVATLPAGPTDGRVFAIRTDLSDDELLDLCAFRVARSQVSIRVVSMGPETGDAAGDTDMGSRSGIAGTSMPEAPESRSVRVPMRQLDQLARLAGDLAIAQAMLRHCAGPRGIEDQAALQAGLDDLQHKLRDLQQLALAMRTAPIAAVFQRFPRMLRELSGKLGKRFKLETHGEHTQIERALAERLVDPLSHLIRNSCSHGIETAAERAAAGKPAVGTIVLSADVAGDEFVIEVRDDGQGLVRKEIVAALSARGLNVPGSMPDREVWQLAILPGVSTASVVTDLSGRGVGLDVVQRNLSDLGGVLEIDSIPGQGTTVRLRFPRSRARSG